MKIEVTYSMGNQMSFCPFPDTKEGIKSAMRFVKQKERLGWRCEPSLIILKHKLENIK